MYIMLICKEQTRGSSKLTCSLHNSNKPTKRGVIMRHRRRTVVCCHPATTLFCGVLFILSIERIVQFQYLRNRQQQERRINYYYSYNTDPLWIIDKQSNTLVATKTNAFTDKSIGNNNNNGWNNNYSSNNQHQEHTSSLPPATTAIDTGEAFTNNLSLSSNIKNILLQTNSIVEYRKKVNASNILHTNQCNAVQQQRERSTTSSGNSNFESKAIERALNCVEMTWKNQQQHQQYIYPYHDADEHYNTIRHALAQYSQYTYNHTVHIAKKYRGPWIENQFSTYFETMYDNYYNNNDTTNSKNCLRDFFGPYIPIFIPWVDHLVQNHHISYPNGLIETIQKLLRPNVLYITVSQNDEGITGKQNLLNLTSIPNLIVLSAGGYGHVPIPLLKQEERYIEYHTSKDDNKKMLRRIPIQDRTIEISYVGSLKNAPYGMRRKMHEIMIKHNTTIIPTYHQKNSNNRMIYEYYYGPQWREIVINSKFSLVPRGFGRSAYHLMEVLQMGYIPIYVYLSSIHEPKWIPYAELYNEIGYSCTIDELDELITMLRQNVTNEEIRIREERIAQLRSSHFTYKGVLEQIHQFMVGDDTSSLSANDLRCQSLPVTVTGKR